MKTANDSRAGHVGRYEKEETPRWVIESLAGTAKKTRTISEAEYQCMLDLVGVANRVVREYSNLEPEPAIEGGIAWSVISDEALEELKKAAENLPL